MMEILNVYENKYSNLKKIIFLFLPLQGWATYRLSIVMRHNDANNVTLPPSAIYVIYSFLKNISNALDSKKVDFIFEEPLSLHITVGQLFFLFRLWFQEETELSWRNYLIKRQTEVRSTIHQIHRIYLFSYQQLQ